MKIEISQAAFDKLRVQLLATHQADITGTNTGVITGHGVTANYQYDGKTLTVDVVHHPFYVPVSTIESQLRDAAQKAGMAA